MTSILRIEGDPAQWTLGPDSPAEVIQQAFTSGNGPVTVDVAAPLKGRLILSPRTVASVAVLTLPAGYIPGGAILPRATLYLPSPAGPTANDEGYTLGPSVNLAALESEIVTAITDGTTISIPVAYEDSMGFLLLNGGTLPFAVLCPPTTR